MDIIAFIAGLIVGIVAVSIAVEFAWKKSMPEKTCKLLKKWDLATLRNPLIVAEKLSITPPPDAKIVVATPTSLENARENPDVKGNFAVGLNKAYIFAGEIKEGQLAFVTSDDDILRELREIFYAYYKVKERVTSYVPKEGKVKIRGIVRAVFPYRDGYLMRLSYEEGIVGVILKERMDIEGKRVEVEGEVIEYPFIKPTNITILD